MIFKKQQPVPPPVIALTPEVTHEVLFLLGGRKKINAIKLIREQTRVGLKEAKDLADAMEQGYRPPAPGHHGRPDARFLPPGAPVPLSERVRAFRDGGDRPSAVALVQAETGMSREEAERFVNALD